MLLPTEYTLPTNCPVRWTTAQERALSSDFPLPGPSSQSTPSTLDLLKSVYSQFLWLPESITPLTQLVSAIQRAFPSPSAPSSPHAALDELESLLLTARQCGEKYHTKIPQTLLSHNPEEGETADGEDSHEEDMSMMWFAFRHDKPTQDDEAEYEDGKEDEVEDRWRKAWLARMERREVQIQILLHFFLLQHPRPTPSPAEQTTAKKKRKKHGQKQQDPTNISLEARLESLMDKLAMWQLLSSIDTREERRSQIKGKGKGKLYDNRDWMQRFCEDIVQPAFSKALPEFYALLHTKVFQHTLFSSSSGEEEEEIAKGPSSRKQQPQQPKPTKSQKPLRSERATNTESTRARSRSLSISLEAERRATNNTAANANRKRLLSREVSMTKVFKKSKAAQPPNIVTTAVIKKTVAPGIDTGSNKVTEKGRVLVESTPVKASKHPQKFLRTESRGAVVKMEVDEDDLSVMGDANIFAATTPVKGGGSQSSSSLFNRFLEANDDEDGSPLTEEEEWMIELPTLRAMSRTSTSSDHDDPGSPDALVLGN